MIDKEKHDIVRQFLRSVTVPILYKPPESIGGQAGTGTFIEFRNKYFLITAGHIFEKAGEHPLQIPSAPNNAKIVKLGHFVLHKPELDLVDVALLELQDSATIAIIKKGWRALQREQGAIATKGVFLLCGFPLKSIKHTDTNRIGTPLLMAYMQRLPELPELPHNAEEAHGNLDLFFYHSTQGLDLDGAATRVPDLVGTSGASIWQYYEPPERSIWSPETSLRIVGVQSAVMPGRYIRAKSWEFVWYILDRMA